MNETILEMKQITKIYGNGVLANDKVDFSVRKGEIHALMGENGAGKSTLMKLLFGIERPEEGEIYIHGKQVQIKSPIDALRLGIGMVHQHFMLVAASGDEAAGGDFEGLIPGGGDFDPGRAHSSSYAAGDYGIVPAAEGTAQPWPHDYFYFP